MTLDGARVALIGPLPPELGGATPGGVATHQAHLAAGLVEQGVAACLLATNVWSGCHAKTPFPMRGMRRLRLTEPAYLRSVGAGPLVRYTLQVAGTRVAGSRRELLEQLVGYRAFLCSLRPAVVHVQHPLERQRIVRQVLELERVRVPVVVTAHSFFGEHPDELVHGLMAPNVRAADRVIAVSPHIAEQAIQLGASPERVRLIRSGVDTQRFRPRDRQAARRVLGIPDERPLVLFVGNLEPRKQLDVLLRAVSSVRQTLGELELAVVGSGASAGAEDQTDALVRLTSQLGLAGCVRFVGRASAGGLLDWYAAADVFALPSSSEAQGIVALEAMACSLPVVASAVGGLLGTIEDGQTGYLVPSGDVGALAERLASLLADAPRRAAVGAAARHAVERDFSWPRAVQATIELYAEVLAEWR